MTLIFLLFEVLRKQLWISYFLKCYKNNCEFYEFTGISNNLLLCMNSSGEYAISVLLLTTGIIADYLSQWMQRIFVYLENSIKVNQKRLVRSDDVPVIGLLITKVTIIYNSYYYKTLLPEKRDHIILLLLLKLPVLSAYNVMFWKHILVIYDLAMIIEAHSVLLWSFFLLVFTCFTCFEILF